MLSKIIDFVKDNKEDLILFITVVMVSLLSFALGYISANAEKEPIKAEKQAYEYTCCDNS